MKFLSIQKIYFASAILLFTACQENKKNPHEQQILPIEKYQAAIDSLENKMHATRNLPIDHATAMFAMKLYEEYASYFPNEKNAPVYLFKAGELANSLQMPQPALNYFNRLINKYPDYKNIPYALFMQAMVYGDQLNDTTKARQVYQSISEKYPGTQLDIDARASIENLGKSTEEIIREFESKQNTSTRK